MNAIDYLKAKERLCMKVKCDLCPLRDIGCTDLERTDPEKMIEKIQVAIDDFNLLSDFFDPLPEPKACPFCGSEDALSIYNLFGEFRIECDREKGGCGAIAGRTREIVDAVNAWNKRAS